MPENLPAYLEALLAASHDPALLLDDHFQIVRSNDQFRHTFALQDAALGQSTLVTLQNGAWQQSGLITALEPVLLGNTALDDLELVLKISGLPEKNLLINARRFDMGAKSGTGLFVVIEDLTEKRKAQQALHKAERKRQESENLFQVVADTAPVMIWLAGTDRRCYFFNKAWLEFTGKTLQQEVADGWEHNIHPDDARRCVLAYDNAFESRTEFRIEYRMLRQDGSCRWVADKGVPRYDLQGEFAGYAGSVSDIHDQKDLSDTLEKMVRIRTEELEQSRSFLQSVLNSTFYGIASYKPLFDAENEISDFRVVYTNPEVPANFGLTISDVEDRTCRDVYPGIFDNGVFEKMKHCFQTGVPASYEIELRQDNQSLWLSAAIEKVHDSLTITSKNITQEKKAALHLSEVNEELMLKNKELASLTYIASHDLQEPLRKIQMFISRVLETEIDTLSAQGKTYFKNITHTALRMQNLIDAVLSYSRMDSEQFKKERTNLNTLLKEVLSQMDLLLEEREVTVNRGELPTLKVIPIHLQQLFLNIINNAVKYSKADVKPIIDISAQSEMIADKPFWRITFADNGIGFDPQYKDKIFEAFQRLHGKMEYAGTGIGLAICQKIAAKHGGFITAEGVPDQGATFHVFLSA